MINASLWGVEQVTRLAESLVLRTRRALDASGEDIGNFCRDTIRLHIMEQDLGWEPLSPVTIARKNDTSAWIETGMLYQNLFMSKTITRTSTVYKIGVPAHLSYSDGTSVARAAAENEFGSDKVPPRPLFRPSVQETKDYAKNHFAKFFAEEMRRG